MSLSPGQRLGPYEILGAIGAGGMGEVYRAHDTRLDRDVAVKVLPASVSDDPERMGRFEREAKAIAALSHPNILAIFDVGTEASADGSGPVVRYAVTELLEGDTLRARLEGGPLTVRKTIEIAVQVARGLAAAHDKGLVHRDLKPDNIFLLDDGHVKILDFGLARQAVAAGGSDATRTVAAVTDPGTVLGTVGYMAPEMVRGQTVDARSDLFALGAVIYEMLAGRRAFERETSAETMTAILKEDPPELVGSRAEISPALDRIVRHCLEKNPAERFQSARDVAFALGALSGSNVSGPSGIVTAGPTRPDKRGRLRMFFGLWAALAAGVLLGYLGSRPDEAAGPRPSDITYQPVTFDEGFVFAARFAQDGRTIVYSADWDEQARDVFVTSVDSPESRPLGLTGSDLVALSRSNELAILDASVLTYGNPYRRTGTLARASLTGGAPKLELEDVLFADFAPDETMAVVRAQATRFALEYPIGHVLTEAGALFTPRISPTGAYVAVFGSDVSQTRPGSSGNGLTVMVFERSGKLVAESQRLDDWWSLAWTPTSEVWFAAAEVAGQQTALFGLDLAGNQRRLLNIPGALTLHDISAQGDVLGSFDQPNGRIEILDASSAEPLDLSWKLSGEVAGFSNDHLVLFTQTDDSGGPRGSVYVRRPDEAQPVRIAEGAGLALSSDGRMALVRTPEGLSRIPTGVGQPSRLDVGELAERGIDWAGWHPDGRIVIGIGRESGTVGVYAVPAGGGTPEALLPAGIGLSGHNLISPDGTRIVALDADDRRLVCELATSSCQPLEGIQADEEVAGWHADSASIFVCDRAQVPFTVHRLDVATGQRTVWRTIQPRQAAVSGIRELAAAPDGAIVYGYRRSRTQLYVIRGLK